MGDLEMIKKVHDAKTVSAQIPENLYWAFKRVQAERKETAQDAIVNAIRIYVEIPTIIDTSRGNLVMGGWDDAE